ncbi:MAG: serine/threonine protein kinase [Planctomycetota bacterium]|nr:MAG: serine/threonine protein kinase [Planctomycetota bacterium]
MGGLDALDPKQLIGRRFGSVVLIRELGRGAMAAVYLGYQQTLKRQVAVKLLPREQTASPEAMHQFRDEAETAAVLSHPNIVQVFEVGQTDDFHYIIMQRIVGVDLAMLIRQRAKHPVPERRRLPPKWVIAWVIEVLDALHYAHKRGVSHQDIKPSNVMIDKETRRALIVDFGIARTLKAEYWAEGMVVGTPRYAAPEQVAGQPPDPRVDVYAAGLVLYEALAGWLPLRDQNDARKLIARKLRAPHTLFDRPPSAVAPDIDARLERIILHAIAPDPADRYADCAAFRRDLAHYLPTLATKRWQARKQG